MKYLEGSRGSAAEDLALDEWLLTRCEAGAGEECLRLWMASAPFVVVGYGNDPGREVDLAACRREGIQVYKRCSGGGTVVQGEGCLNYAVVLRVDGGRPVETIPRANRYVLGLHREVLSRLLGGAVEVRGVTDLAVGQAKFSGNAQRRGRRALLFHGTFLLQGVHQGLVALMERVLRQPSREPAYRHGRAHGEFVRGIDVSRAALEAGLREIWSANEEGPVPDADELARLAAAKYRPLSGDDAIDR